MIRRRNQPGVICRRVGKAVGGAFRSWRGPLLSRMDPALAGRSGLNAAGMTRLVRAGSLLPVSTGDMPTMEHARCWWCGAPATSGEHKFKRQAIPRNRIHAAIGSDRLMATTTTVSTGARSGRLA
jgi:hypothetical protein